MLQTLVYVAACFVPFGIFVWSLFNERALTEIDRKRKRDELDQTLKR
jgi:hypothetical protein